MTAFTLLPFSSAPRVPFKFDGRILYSCENYELVHLTLQPGEGMELHAQPFDLVFFIAEGSGALTVGEERIETGVNTTVHVPAGVMRAWKNTGNIPLRILVNKLLIKT
jgi:mannose-6-phosphate isomerase-like protein (cupin superfamily)